MVLLSYYTIDWAGAMVMRSVSGYWQKKNDRGHPHQKEQGDHEPGQRSTATNCMKPHTQSTLTSTSCTGFSPLIKIGTVNAIIIIITKLYNDGLCRV